MIIIAIIVITCMYNIPWMYLKYKSSDNEVQQILYKDFKTSDNSILNIKTYNIFNSPCTNCTNNSKNYIGITIDDLSNIPRTIVYCFYALISLGIFLTIYAIYDRYKNYSEKTNFIIHSIFASGIIIICVIILLESIKFLSTHMLLYYNINFIKAIGIDDIRLIFIIPTILVIISILLIIIGITIIKINFKDIEKKLQFYKPDDIYSAYKYRSKQ